MSRISLFDPSHAEGESKELFETIQGSFGIVPNVFRVFGSSAAALKGYLNFNSALSGGLLPSSLREQLALTVSEINGCDYCLSAHSFFGGKVGLSHQEIDAARHAKAIDEKNNAALEFARAVTVSRGRVANSEVAAVRAAGFTDAELLEIVSHVSLTTLTNYVNNVAETEIDFPIVAASSSFAENAS